jgi:peptidyl-tRNA hydrolase, PTH1 family
MKLIAGLGNPGPRYRNTRHNAGFMVLDTLADSLGLDFSREKFGGLVAEGRVGAEKVLLLKPLTFMNNSGQSVAQAARNNTDEPRDLLVVVDDVHLPLGRLRLRGQGSAGGHNGLKSVIACLGSDAFARLRVGIGASDPGNALVDHVLGTFRPDEAPLVREAVARAAEAALLYVREGISAAMDAHNTDARKTREQNGTGTGPEERKHA